MLRGIISNKPLLAGTTLEHYVCYAKKSSLLRSGNIFNNGEMKIRTHYSFFLLLFTSL